MLQQLDRLYNSKWPSIGGKCLRKNLFRRKIRRSKFPNHCRQSLRIIRLEMNSLTRRISASARIMRPDHMQPQSSLNSHGPSSTRTELRQRHPSTSLHSWRSHSEVDQHLLLLKEKSISIVRLIGSPPQSTQACFNRMTGRA